jgi:hypothetical protein
MKTGNLFGKSLAISLIILFFTMASISAVGVSINSIPMNQSSANPPTVFKEGIMGENDWYISDVLISFSYDPKIVKEIGYELDGTWHEYVNPFFVEDDGIHYIPWYWIDEDDVRHDMFAVGFKIDQSKPTINIAKEVIAENKVKFTVTCNDDVSDVERVEFYLDDDLITTNTEKPYEYTYTTDQSGAHDVFAIGYNFAGLSEVSETLDTKEKSRSWNLPFLNNFFQRIYYLVYLIQQIVLN